MELDLPSLLAPLEGESRVGRDLREDDEPDNAYRIIRGARNDARDQERQADLNGESSVEAMKEWRKVWDNGQDYLQSCGKDLEIVAYMIEASIRIAGLRGLACALDLTKELIENYWGELLPTPDEDGFETTLLPISRLNGDVITYPILRVPMTEDTSIGQFVVWQYTQAKQLEGLKEDERSTRVERGAVTMEVFNRAVAETSDQFYQGLAAEIEDAIRAVSELSEVLDQKVGEELAPNFSRFTSSLAEAETTLRIIAGDRIANLAESDEGEGDSSSDGEAGASGGDGTGKRGSGMQGEVSSRDEALKILEKVAAWFERHEPQSILPAEIRKARRRAMMTPQQLYMDLISDESARESLFRDVGINPDTSDDSGD